MSRSKSTEFLKALPFLTLFVLVSACSMPHPEEAKDTGNSATFYIDKTTQTVNSQQLDSGLSIPLSKSFNFSACFKDIQLSKPVINHQFTIHGGDSDQTATTDSNGCLIWTEKISYNHLAPAQFVEFKRAFETHGFQKGQREMSFALNPWEDKAISLLDTKLQTYVKAADAPAALQGSVGSSGSNSTVRLAPLSMEDLAFTLKEDSISNQGVNVSISIAGPISLLTVKSSGQTVPETLTYGKFEAEIVLVNSMSVNQKETLRSLTAPVKVQGQISANILTFKTKLLLGPLAKSGQIQLGLKVTALDTKLSLAPFEQVYPIGEYDQIKGKFMLKGQNSNGSDSDSGKSDFHLETFIGTVAPAPALGSAEAMQMAAVVVAPLKFSAVRYQNTTALNRQKVFSITACLSGPIDKKALAAQTFSITKLNHAVENVVSNEFGCIQWDDSVTFDLLAKECWQDGLIQIANDNLGMKQSFSLKINPWDQGESSVRDLRSSSVQNQAAVCADGRSQVVLSNYSFDKKNNVQYQIDSFLNLKVQKEVILRLQPHLKRPSLTDPSGFEEVPMPNGKYLLRWALVSSQTANFQKPESDLFQAQSKVVEVRGNGTISESILLESPDLKSIGNTSQLLLEITPAEGAPTAAFSIATFRGPLVLANNSQGANLELLQESDRSLIESLAVQLKAREQKIAAANLELSKKSVIAKNQNAALFNLTDEQSTLALRKSMASPSRPGFMAGLFMSKLAPVSNQDLINWVQSGKMSDVLATQFRQYWCVEKLRTLAPTSSLEASRFSAWCVHLTPKATDLFDVQYLYFLKNPSKVQELSSQIRDVSFNTAFTVNHAKGQSESTTISVDASAGIGTPKFLGMSASMGGRVQHGWSSSDLQGSNVAETFQSGLSALMERLNFKIRADGYEKCAVIKLNPRLYLGVKSPLVRSLDSKLPIEQQNSIMNQGFMFCAGAVVNKPIEMTESYFIFNQKTFNAQAIDSNSDLGRSLFVSLRGLTDFKKFVSLLSGKLTVPGSAQAETQLGLMVKDNSEADFVKGVSAEPGVFTADQ